MQPAYGSLHLDRKGEQVLHSIWIGAKGPSARLSSTSQEGRKLGLVRFVLCRYRRKDRQTVVGKEEEGAGCDFVHVLTYIMEK